MRKLTILFIALFIPEITFSQDIDYMEYFIDSDPGYGMGTPIAVTETGSDVSLDFIADMASFQQGFHYLNIRARDDLGKWSHGANRVFYLVKILDVNESNIDWLEYFIDTDPGFGNAVAVRVPPGNEPTLTFSPDLQGLDHGIHIIYFRVKDKAGRWGLVANAVFFFVEIPSSAESNIQQLEYFIDTDPGYGLGTPVTLPSAGSDLTIDFSVSLGGVSDGYHVLYIRAKNEFDKWGQVYAEGFAYNAVGLDQEEINSLFKIYPNPSNGIIQIELADQLQSDFRIRLMDLNGKLVYESESHSKLFELNLELPGGMYLLNIESAERSITQKIILE